MEEPSLPAVCADTQRPTGQLFKTTMLVNVSSAQILLDYRVEINRYIYIYIYFEMVRSRKMRGEE